MNPDLEGRDLADFAPVREKGTVAGSPRGWLIVHGLAWGAFLVGLALVMRRFETVFADFGVDLPGFTVLLIKAAHVTNVLGVPLFLGLLAADWSVLKALARGGRSKEYRAWSVLMLVVPGLLIAATIVGLALPLLTIMTRLTG